MSGARSPSASPRLPSPPPIAEDQTGPASPTPAAREPVPQAQSADASANASSSRRIRPGTKSADMAEGPPLESLDNVVVSMGRVHNTSLTAYQIDSAFALAEHLKSLYAHYTVRIEPSNDPKTPPRKSTIPIDRETATIIAQPPAELVAAGSDEGDVNPLWLYELCRFLIQKTNNIVIALFRDKCSAQSCPEMRASEWQYLCAVHDPPKSCCAIDYTCHTLDWASNVLTSPKHFASRLAHTISTESLQINAVSQAQQMRSLLNIFRRVYRIYAHAWFQHREVFWQVEGRYGLYILFKVVCDYYQLIPDDNYTIPPEAEGLPGDDAESNDENQRRSAAPAAPAVDANRPQTILRRPEEGAGGDKVKRHRHTPSKGAPVATVVEEDEESEAETVLDASENAVVDTAEEKVESMPLLEDDGGAKAEERAGEEAAKAE